MSTPSQCASCSGVDRHTTNCPEVLGVWPARGDEVCGSCRNDVGEFYTHLEHTQGVEIVSEADLVVCLGCAAHAAIGTLP